MGRPKGPSIRGGGGVSGDTTAYNSNKEVDENEGRNQVLSFTGKHHKRFNGSLLNSGGYEDDEDIASV